MKAVFYWKLAMSGIYKNRKIYFPYILSCIGMIMMEYIIIFLTTDESVANLPGGGTMQMFLGLGIGIIAIFSLFFLFYTNSFLMRRRKKEFGLYSILGMGRFNLELVLFWESLFIAVVSLILGLLGGILFSKAAQLVMAYMLHGDGGFSLRVGPMAMQMTCMIFLAIFMLIFLNGLRQVHRTKPIELLRSENVGEKPPKANWVLAFLGAAVLALGYFIAVRIDNPMSALLAFFVAVIFVIIATYLLFIAGSVCICRLLKMNKKYYYKTSHFISIASMSYRMKRNGAGLASICILCTAVLVMLSSTASLYLGTEDLLRHRYPRNIVIDTPSVDDDVTEQIQAKTGQVLDSFGLEAKNVLSYKVLDLSGALVGDSLVFDSEALNSLASYSNIRQLFIISLEDYNRLTGSSETLEEDEILLYTTKAGYSGDTLDIEGYGSVHIKKHLTSFIRNGIDTMQVIPSLFIFVPDLNEAIQKFDAIVSDYDPESLDAYKRSYYGVDLDCDKAVQIEAYQQILDGLHQLSAQNGYPFTHISSECMALERDSIYALYSGLFFLGILLGLVCLGATVMIMYYKQITEGYEDKERFEILQKVGLTHREVGKIINSQVLTVFFAPLLAAGIHLAVAFKIISIILAGFGLFNTGFIIIVTILCFVAFAIFYTIVYIVTSRAYYRIVSARRR